MPEFSNPFMVSTPQTTLSEDDIIRAVRFMISAELEAINQYDLVREHSFNSSVRQVLRSIVTEEKKHVGELLTLLYALSPIDRSFAADGNDEVSSILANQLMVESQASAT